jgi:hypothetical protein
VIVRRREISNKVIIFISQDSIMDIKSIRIVIIRLYRKEGGWRMGDGRGKWAND